MVLRNGLVYSNGQCRRLDVLVRDGRIARLAPALDCPDEAAFDLNGLVLSPGFIDLHAHLREPGFAEKETIRSGTAAAAAGGFTTVCAMPNLNPVPDTLENLRAERALIERDAQVEVLPYGAITRGERGEALADLEAMAPFCAGFSDDGRGVQSPALMREAMARCAALGKMIVAHCEDENLRTPGGCVHDGAAARRFGIPGIGSDTEWRQLARDLALAEETGVRYHVCHVSAKESVALLRAAKRRGLAVTCECTPHQLALCEDDITQDDGRYKMNPPLRARADREALVEGLLDGTIDCVATDHAPHTAAEKARGLSGSAFGVVGLETAFAACYTALVQTGLCTLPLLLERLTARRGGFWGARSKSPWTRPRP
jgi:dihydroorotase